VDKADPQSENTDFFSFFRTGFRFSEKGQCSGFLLRVFEVNSVIVTGWPRPGYLQPWGQTSLMKHISCSTSKHVFFVLLTSYRVTDILLLCLYLWQAVYIGTVGF
jgi:hypothetical protein